LVIKEIEVNDESLQTAVDIYNSNIEFLIHHIGKDYVDKDFILNEIKEMKEHGFTSNFIIEDDEPVGVIDYSLNEEGYVYLSLLMLEHSMQGKKLGSAFYGFFEKEMVKQGANIIRIDVVNDHTPNVIPFWEDMGFEGQEELELSWGDKTSTVLVMMKKLV
jgi:GNAT superfamily N-acetyltransferase